MATFECVGKCGKTVCNNGIDLSGHDVAGAICPDCAKSHGNAEFGFSEEFAGWALLSPAVVEALEV